MFWRSDGSGDTYAFTSYLSDVSGAVQWQGRQLDHGELPGRRRREGQQRHVAGDSQHTNGAIAYIAVSYLIANRLPAAAIKNAAGNYVVPNLSAHRSRGVGRPQRPAGNELTIVNPPKRAKKAYPISTFTYAFVADECPAGSAAAVVHRLRDHRRPAVRALARLRRRCRRRSSTRTRTHSTRSTDRKTERCVAGPGADAPGPVHVR